MNCAPVPALDLAAFAGVLGMSWAEFSAYNPAFKRYITPPDRHVSVYVPYHAEARADKLLRDGKLSGRGWATYTIVRNDTLGKISRRTGVPVTVLRQANPRCEPLKIGRKLRIPGTGKGGEYMIASAKSSSAEASPAKTAPAKAASREAGGRQALRKKRGRDRGCRVKKIRARRKFREKTLRGRNAVA